MTCQFIKSNGIQCGAHALTESNFCFSHDPAMSEEKKMAVFKGGLARKRFMLSNTQPVALNNSEDAKNFLSQVINGVWTGEIPATPIGTALGFLVRCFLDAQDRTDIENRIKKLEKEVILNKEQYA